MLLVMLVVVMLLVMLVVVMQLVMLVVVMLLVATGDVGGGDVASCYW